MVCLRFGGYQMGTALAEDRTSTLPLGDELLVIVTHFLLCRPLAVRAPLMKRLTVDENKD